jgi:hypothetical protein
MIIVQMLRLKAAGYLEESGLLPGSSRRMGQLNGNVRKRRAEEGTKWWWIKSSIDEALLIK